MGLNPNDGFGKEVMENALANDEQQHSKLLDIAAHVPSAKVSAGWNALRGERTILKGSHLAGNVGKANSLGFSVKGTIHPANWGRMPNAYALDAYTGRGPHYSPFNFLSSEPINKIGASVVKKSTRLQNALFEEHELAGVKSGQGGELFSGGVYSRLSASARLAGWGDSTASVKAGHAANLGRFLGKTDPALAARATELYGQGLTGATKAQAADLNMMSVRGRASQFIGGYFRGASGLGEGSVDLAGSMGRFGFKRGAELATEHLAAAGLERSGSKLVIKAGSEVGEKLMAKGVQKVGVGILGDVAAEAGAGVAARAGLAMGARAVGMAIPGVNIAMTAMMAYDITKMAIASMKGGVAFAQEGFKSAQGSLYKPAMGMGYKDTEVAATSRQRGVMAIQNSRLNARSALGNEAAPLAAHFG